jgi:hypothetical protein
MRRLAPVVLLVALVGCGGNTEVVKTVTVEQATDTPSTTNPFAKLPKKRHAERRVQVTSASASGYVHCDSNIEVKAATTTCPFAQNTFWHYWTSDEASDLQVWSPAAHSTFDVSCTVDYSRVACTTADDGVVRFPLAAVDNYSQEQADAYAARHDLGPDPYESLPVTPPSEEPDDSPEAPALLRPSIGRNIPNYENGRGYRVQCADGMYSHSGGIQGACSHHGGVAP